MCGIALCLSGVKIEGHLAAIAASGIPPPHQEAPPCKAPSINDLCTALKRRGPDNLDTETLHVRPARGTNATARDENNSFPGIGTSSVTEATGSMALAETGDGAPTIKIELVGASLQLRGDHPVAQPLRDSAGNVLVYNGEIFGGLEVQPGENDTELLMAALGSCCTCSCHASCAAVAAACPCVQSDSRRAHKTVPETLSCLRGPWALVFWQAEHQILWFGRDVLGRRSLLLHRPSRSDPRLLLASVAPAQTLTAAEEKNGGAHAFEYWEELPCGIHSISLDSKSPQEAMTGAPFVGVTQLHEWEDPVLRKLILWDRQCIDPSSCIDPLAPNTHHQETGTAGGALNKDPQTRSNNVPQSNEDGLELDPMLRVLTALRRSVRKRTSDIRRCHWEPATGGTMREPDRENHEYTPIAVLFSGGLDSMILAALADECLQPHCGIDLLNVSFEGAIAPDRISAVAGLAELQRVSPCRRWRLVEVNADLAALNSHRNHLQSLICPSNTYMDLNIGTALWLAAKGQGSVHDSQGVPGTAYTSRARVLLVGAGADEQCGGYGRHRTKFRLGGWEALQAEMRIDMQRIWKRNLGRDDRCMADVGKEARFPFLDEEVVEMLLEMPLWDIVDLRQPIGRGDKKILREVAMSLGLTGASSLPKRAIQFGSRIARESNKREFGSNRAANQASAGSAVLPGLVHSS